ncbi:MAG: hypothetical protein ACON5H_03260 [Akkermansiaceae bacterium]
MITLPDSRSLFSRVPELPAATLRRLAVLLFGLISAVLWIGFSVDTFFASDGPYYFKVLCDKMWFTGNAPARAHAEFISQWPMVLAVNIGVTDLKVLEIIFGFGLWFPWLIGFLISFYATREKPFLIFFYLLSLASLNLAAWALMIGEHLVLLSVAWPLFFLAIIKRPLNGIERILALLLLVAHLKLYESAMVTGSIFAVLFFLRAWVFEEKEERLWSAAFIVIALGAVAIALQWTIFPRDAENRSSFLSAMIFSFGHSYPWIGMAFLIFTTLSQFFRKRLFFKLSLIVPIVLVLFSLTAPGVPGNLSFSTRTLTLSVLPIFFLISGTYAFSFVRAGKILVSSTSLIVVLISLLHLRHLQSWISFRSLFKSVLAEESGFIKPEPYGEPLKHWGWTNPLLSYLWSDGTVKTVILKPGDEGPEDESWRPFNPYNEIILERYLSGQTKVVDEGLLSQ